MSPERIGRFIGACAGQSPFAARSLVQDLSKSTGHLAVTVLLYSPMVSKVANLTIISEFAVHGYETVPQLLPG